MATNKSVVETAPHANPADLPIDEPTKFELVIHLKTDKALGRCERRLRSVAAGRKLPVTG